MPLPTDGLNSSYDLSTIVIAEGISLAAGGDNDPLTNTSFEACRQYLEGPRTSLDPENGSGVGASESGVLVGAPGATPSVGNDMANMMSHKAALERS